MNTLTNSTPAPGLVSNYLHVLKSYANFKGRARRSEYWYFVLINTLVSTALSFVDGLLMPTGSGFLSLAYTLAVLVPSIAVCIRRMHDVGKSGWFALIPIYNFILAITEGTKGANEHGSDPKAESVARTAQPVA